MTARHSRPQTPAAQSPLRRPRSPAALAWLVTLLLAATIATAAFVATGRPARPAPPATSQRPAAAPPTFAAVTPTARATTGRLPALPHGPTGPAHAAPSATAQTSPPTRLLIAAIRVDTGLESLGRLPDGTLQPPAQWGWTRQYPATVVARAVYAPHVSRHRRAPSAPHPAAVEPWQRLGSRADLHRHRHT